VSTPIGSHLDQTADLATFAKLGLLRPQKFHSSKNETSRQLITRSRASPGQPPRTGSADHPCCAEPPTTPRFIGLSVASGNAPCFFGSTIACRAVDVGSRRPAEGSGHDLFAFRFAETIMLTALLEPFDRDPVGPRCRRTMPSPLTATRAKLSFSAFWKTGTAAIAEGCSRRQVEGSGASTPDVRNLW
jgi:hypothetical protein